jgi:predicted permease
VVAEGALALALLIGAGLVLKGFVRLARHDPGFVVDPVLTMHVRISPTDYADNRPAISFLGPALEAVRRVPGVEAAGAISQMPYVEWGWNAWIRYDGMQEVPMTERPLAEVRTVHPGFFAVTGQRLLGGRLLDARDAPEVQPRRIVVNQALVKRDFPDRDPIGQRLYMGEEPAEIVGVVSDIRNSGPFSPPRPEATWTYSQRELAATGYWVLVRVAAGNPVDVAGAVEEALRSVNPRVAVSRVEPMGAVVAESLGRPRFLFSLFGTLGLVALLLALAGLFGMLSYVVEQQRREFGVRAALGAPPARLARDVVSRGAVLVGISAGLGLVIAWFVTRVMESVLYGVDPRDALVWIASLAAMGLAGLAATLGPARRAGTAQPMAALRGE